MAYLFILSGSLVLIIIFISKFNEIQVLTVKENVLKSQTIIPRMAAEFTRILGKLIVHYYFYFLNKQSFLHN